MRFNLAINFWLRPSLEILLKNKCWPSEMNCFSFTEFRKLLLSLEILLKNEFSPNELYCFLVLKNLGD
jgi:hypothetical protein